MTEMLYNNKLVIDTLYLHLKIKFKSKATVKSKRKYAKTKKLEVIQLLARENIKIKYCQRQLNY